MPVQSLAVLEDEDGSASPRRRQRGEKRRGGAGQGRSCAVACLGAAAPRHGYRPGAPDKAVQELPSPDRGPRTER
jgi:hypothetical protein